MLVRRPYGGLARPGENVYTDPTLLHIGGALAALLDLSLSSGTQAHGLRLDALRETGPAGRPAETYWARGRRTLKEAPLPGVLLRLMAPPRSVT